MKKLKNRFLSCLLSAAMIISMVPSTLASGIDAQPLAAGDSITIQEQSITTAATSVTVQVTGYENRSSAKLTLNKFLNGMRSLLSLLSVSTLSLMAM